MRIKFKKIYLLISFLIIVFILGGCYKEQEYTSEMTNEIESNIKEVCAKEYNVSTEEVIIEEFCGGFDEAYVVIVIIDGIIGDHLVREYEIGGIEFISPGGGDISGVVYQNVWYDIKEAYEMGILTKDSLKKLPKVLP